MVFRSFVTSFFIVSMLLVSVVPTHAQQTTRQYKGSLKRVQVLIDPYTLDTLLNPIPFRRQHFHDKIIEELKKADMADGVRDNRITIEDDTSQSEALTTAILICITKLRVMAENAPAKGRDSFSENQEKIRYLNAIYDLAKGYNINLKPDTAYYTGLVSNMRGMLIACNEKKLMDFVMDNTNAYTLNNGHFLFENHPQEREYIYTHLGKEDPVMMVKRLAEFTNDTFATPIITAAAYLVPDVIYNYATSTNYRIRNAIHRCADTVVRVIIRIADSSKASLKALPFFYDIVKGRISIPEIDTIADHPDLYYEQLVRLRIQNDSIGKGVYSKELAYRSLKMVREMNELHEAKDEERFKCIDSLPPECLYNIMVNGQDEIYTSTFLGTFKRMMERLGTRSGAMLLDTLHYDRFRAFIKMCAGYNTLSVFLNSINDTGRGKLMNDFISGLQQGNDSDLEDAVDVADAFGSINDPTLVAFLHDKVKQNYDQAYRDANRKGLVVYGLLGTLLESSKATDNDTGAATTSDKLRIPSINKVSYKDLVNDSGIVYQRVLFFGDEDGKNSYESFIAEFKNDTNWKMEDTTYWTKITSVRGSKIIIYANLPLMEPQDEAAQDSLTGFLKKNSITPTIIIHRGHSYHLAQSLNKLTKNTKIVILGSCGGYHNLSLVLDKSPDAHIVSSKQTGVGAVNEPIINRLNDQLLHGEDVNWIKIWGNLDTYFADKPELKDKFSDYVPPYKNLGAIFIKAYRIKMSRYH